MTYLPRDIKIEPMEIETVDTKLTAIIEPPTKNVLTSKFREDEVCELPAKKERRLWLEILNRSYNHPIKIKKKEFIGEKKRQRGGFLNCYDFAYTGTDVVNHAAKVAPGVIKNASNEINNVGQQRTDQMIKQGGQEMERVLPKILIGAMEDVYQTLFRLLGNFRKQQLNKQKKKILR